MKEHRTIISFREQCRGFDKRACPHCGEDEYDVARVTYSDGESEQLWYCSNRFCGAVRSDLRAR